MEKATEIVQYQYILILYVYSIHNGGGGDSNLTIIHFSSVFVYSIPIAIFNVSSLYVQYISKLTTMSMIEDERQMIPVNMLERIYFPCMIECCHL